MSATVVGETMACDIILNVSITILLIINYLIIVDIIH
jgi:hypothetical protein